MRGDLNNYEEQLNWIVEKAQSELLYSKENVENIKNILSQYSEEKMSIVYDAIKNHGLLEGTKNVTDFEEILEISAEDKGLHASTTYVQDRIQLEFTKRHNLSQYKWGGLYDSIDGTVIEFQNILIYCVGYVDDITHLINTEMSENPNTQEIVNLIRSCNVYGYATHLPEENKGETDDNILAVIRQINDKLLECGRKMSLREQCYAFDIYARDNIMKNKRIEPEEYKEMLNAAIIVWDKKMKKNGFNYN